MSEKKVLIITYYWPPSGGSGVQRWLKFVKYLPQYGWTPYVFTPENPAFDIKDESLLKDIPRDAEVIKLPIWEPYQAFQKLAKIFTGKTVKANPNEMVVKQNTSLFQKLSVWVRANLFIPDPRIFWVRPSVNFLNDFIIENKIQTVITTGPPHSIHLIGLKLKKHNPAIKWIADFRDPWSEWGFLQNLPLLPITKGYIKRLEQRVLQHANEVITVTPSWVKMFEKLGSRRVTLLTNGYDEDDFKSFSRVKSDKFIICHVGIVNEQCNPTPFMQAIKKLLALKPELQSELRIRFIGDVKKNFIEEVQRDEQLKAVTEFIDRVSHEKILEYYREVSISLLVLTGYKEPESYLPGKIFEYIRVGAPVLGVGPVNGDAASVLKLAQSGVMIDSENSTEIIEFVEEQLQRWRNNQPIESQLNILKFSRYELTNELTKLLK
jgi:glycosyltransferase involved in cell wall biosynthesis